MITFLGKSISHFLCRKKIISEDETDVYQYGFETILSTVLIFVITLLAGIVFGMIHLSVTYYIIFVSLRKLTGGYHADSYFKCNTVFTVITLFVLGMTKIICVSQMYTISFHFLLLLIAIICIWRFSPVENVNKPLTIGQKERNHKTSLVILLALCILSTVLYVLKIEFAVLTALTLFSISMLIIIEKMKGGQKGYEEGTE